jgi:hypothetical protein
MLDLLAVRSKYDIRSYSDESARSGPQSGQQIGGCLGVHDTNVRTMPRLLASDHLIRRYPRGCPLPFRSVRDLGRIGGRVFICVRTRPKLSVRVAPKLAPSDRFFIRVSGRLTR